MLANQCVSPNVSRKEKKLDLERISAFFFFFAPYLGMDEGVRRGGTGRERERERETLHLEVEAPRASCDGGSKRCICTGFP